MAGFSVHLMKYVTFFINFLIFAGSLALVIACVSYKYKESDKLINAMNIPVQSVTAILVFAVFSLLVSFFGCCGALKENPCMLHTFAAIVSICLIVQLVCAGVVIGYKGEVLDGLNNILQDDLDKYTENSTSTDNPIIILQQELGCCGVQNYTDWGNYSKAHDQELPLTCCQLNSTSTTPVCKVNADNVWKDGCAPKFENLLKVSIMVIGAFGIILGLIELLAIVFACVMAKAFKRDYDVV